MEEKTYNICSYDLLSGRIINIVEIGLLLKIIGKLPEQIADIICACFMNTEIYAQALIWQYNGLKAADFHKLERKLKVLQKNELKHQENVKINQKKLLDSLRGIVRY